MQFFFIPLFTTSLLASLGVAEHEWPINDEYYRYRGPPAPLSRDGLVVDTPEVARAKAAHLATHAEVVAKMRRESRPDVWAELDGNAVNSYGEEPRDTQQLIYRGPFAPLGDDGRVVDTAEVAQAQAAHLAAHANAAAKASPDYDYRELPNGIWDDRGNHHVYAINHQPSRLAYVHQHSPALYRGPPAPLAPDCRVLETPEVTKAKEAHLRAHAYAATLTAHREPELHFQL